MTWFNEEMSAISLSFCLNLMPGRSGTVGGATKTGVTIEFSLFTSAGRA